MVGRSTSWDDECVGWLTLAFETESPTGQETD